MAAENDISGLADGHFCHYDKQDIRKLMPAKSAVRLGGAAYGLCGWAVMRLSGYCFSCDDNLNPNDNPNLNNNQQLSNRMTAQTVCITVKPHNRINRMYNRQPPTKQLNHQTTTFLL